MIADARRSRGTRSRSLIRRAGPEDDETKTLTLAWPHTQHACMPLSEQRQRRAGALSLCPCIHCALLATRRRHGVEVPEQLCRRAFHARAAGLDAADHLLREVTVCTRLCDRVLRRCHAGTGAVWLRALALSSRSKLTPASPIVMMPVPFSRTAWHGPRSYSGIAARSRARLGV